MPRQLVPLSDGSVYKEQFGSFRYRVRNEDGTEDEKKWPARDQADGRKGVRDEAIRTHKGFKSIIEKFEGITESPEEVLLEPEPQEVLPLADSLEGVQKHRHKDTELLQDDVLRLEATVSRHDDRFAEADSRLVALSEEQRQGFAIAHKNLMDHGHEEFKELDKRAAAIETTLVLQAGNDARNSLETAKVAETVSSLASQVVGIAQQAASVHAVAEIQADVRQLAKDVAEQQASSEERWAKLDELLARIVALEKAPMEEHDHNEYALREELHDHPTPTQRRSRKRCTLPEHDFSVRQNRSWVCSACGVAKED